MTPKLSSDIQRAVEENHGLAEAEANGTRFVVMSVSYYRDMLGIGTDEQLQDSLRAIDEGIADIDAGRTAPAEQFFANFDKKHGISR